MSHQPEMTFVVTSCGRADLLQKTMESFLQHNTYPIKEYILIEDSGKSSMLEFIERKLPGVFDQVLFNETPLKQLASIDRAYSLIQTPYCFHCEDDWLFERGGFIEDSLALLAQDPRIINVWLRALDDTNGHPVEPQTLISDTGLKYRKMVHGHEDQWFGFTLNPTVKRMSDYQRAQPYLQYGHEGAISTRYGELDYYGVILENKAVSHIGRGRHVPREGESALRRFKYWLRNVAKSPVK